MRSGIPDSGDVASEPSRAAIWADYVTGVEFDELATLDEVVASVCQGGPA